MRAVPSLLLSLALLPVSIAQTPVTAQYENLPFVYLYSKGYLLSWDMPQYTQFTLYGRDGKLAFSAPERTGNSFEIKWAVDSDGVVAAAYALPQLRQGRIDMLDLAGNLTSTIDNGA